MADVPLTHLSRPQLVHLLLRIVDLLSQPVTPVQSAPPVVGLPSGSGVELYDARLDPWNAPDEGHVAPSVPRDQGMPVGAGGRHPVQGQLSPAASASGPPACNPQSGCPETPPGLVWMVLDHCLVLSEVATVGYPKLACPLRMPYLGVGRGCTSVAVHVECVVLPAFCSVLDTRTTCVRFTKYRDTAVGTYIRWEIATAILLLPTNWFCTAFLGDCWPQWRVC